MLYLRARLAGYAGILLVATASLGWVWADKYFHTRSVSLPVLLMMPLISAVIIVVGVNNPFGEVERTASLPLAPLRLTHLGGLFAWGAGTLCLAGSGCEWPYPEVALVRNLAGFVGLGLFASRAIGARLSWVAPLAFGVLAYQIGNVEVNQRVEWVRWAWPMRPSTDPISFAIASVLLLAGLGTVCLLEGRDTVGGME